MHYEAGLHSPGGELDGAFVGVAGQRSFRKAAAELGVKPSAIRQAVCAFEARIGAALSLYPDDAQCRPDRSRRAIHLRARPAFGEPADRIMLPSDLNRPRAAIRICLRP